MFRSVLMLLAANTVATYSPAITFTSNGQQLTGSRSLEQIEIFTAGPPSRGYVERGIFSIDNPAFGSGEPDVTELLNKLRSQAASNSCDALVVPVFPTTVRYSTATCIVFPQRVQTQISIYEDQPPLTPSGWSIHAFNDGQPRGMTWGLYDNTRDEDEIGASSVGCGGKPHIDGKDCNAYHGDTLCTDSRPILCGRGDSDFPLSDHYGVGDRNWAAGEIALTEPIQGIRLESQQAGDKLCAASLGRAWKMVEFHHGGGWNFAAIGQLKSGSRFWVAINDQKANCWDKQ